MARTEPRCARQLRSMLLRSVICAGVVVAPVNVSAQGIAEVASELPFFTLPRFKAPFSPSASSLRDSLVFLARAQLGRRYVFGGETPDRGFDCSGLVRYVTRALHIALPRTAAQQDRMGEPVARDITQLLPGDLITFGRGKRASHVGIYVGGGRFIHASSAAGKVIESNLQTRIDRPLPRRMKPWRGARRIFTAGDSAVVIAGPDAS